MKAKRYYTLLVRYEAGDAWKAAFGDYDRETVVDERDDSYADAAATKIIATAPDQASIDAEVAQLNGGGK